MKKNSKTTSSQPLKQQRTASTVPSTHALKAQIESLDRKYAILSQQVSQISQRIRASRNNEVALAKGLLAVTADLHACANAQVVQNRLTLIGNALQNLLGSMIGVEDFATLTSNVDPVYQGFDATWLEIIGGTMPEVHGIVDLMSPEDLAVRRKTLTDLLEKMSKTLEQPLMPVIKLHQPAPARPAQPSEGQNSPVGSGTSQPPSA